MIKSELRKNYLERRSTLTDKERSESSCQIAERYFENFELSAVDVLHCFIPIPKFNEIDTSLIYRRLWAENPLILTLAPRVDRPKGILLSIPFGSETEVRENAWGISEPTSDGSVDATKIDMVLVPLLCFDQSGHRVGYGKGYYDMFLSICRRDCLKVGLSFFPPVRAIQDVQAHDVRLDRCITPDTIYSF